jgi:hypothetical protein
LFFNAGYVLGSAIFGKDVAGKAIVDFSKAAFVVECTLELFSDASKVSIFEGESI